MNFERSFCLRNLLAKVSFSTLMFDFLSFPVLRSLEIVIPVVGSAESIASRRILIPASLALDSISSWSGCIDFVSGCEKGGLVWLPKESNVRKITLAFEIAIFWLRRCIPFPFFYQL